MFIDSFRYYPSKNIEQVDHYHNEGIQISDKIYMYHINSFRISSLLVNRSNLYT